MKISVIMNRVPSDSGAFERYLEWLAEDGRVGEVLFRLGEAEASNRIQIDAVRAVAAGSKLPVRVLTETGSPQATLNRLVGMARYDNFLYLDFPYRLDGLDIGELSNRLSDEPRLVLLLSGRVAFGRIDEKSWSNHDALLPESAVNSGSLSFMTSRRLFLEVRGFDEDAGKEDCYLEDLILRFRRLPLRVVHELNEAILVRSTELEYLSVPSGTMPRERNVIEAQLYNDRSIFRNLSTWSVPPRERPPLISVAIATKNRADLLVESIRSVLYQSFQEFEIVVVDDGSDQPELNRAAIEEIGDPRVKYVGLNRSFGVAHARNVAADETNCLLTAVHDDDDLMLPSRLETGIRYLTDEITATYGSWVNFDDNTAEMILFRTKDGFGRELIQYFNQSPGHSTWTLYTDVIRRLRYDETLTSAVDHNLAVRSLRDGQKWLHAEKVMYLRRVHAIQITAQDGGRQKAAAHLTRIGNRFLVSEEHAAALSEQGRANKYPKIAEDEDLFKHFGVYLPDHLVERKLVAISQVPDSIMPYNFSDRAVSTLEDREVISGQLKHTSATVEDIKQEDLVELRNGSFRSGRIIAVKKMASESEKGPNGQGDTGLSAIEDMALKRSIERVREEVLERLQVVRRTFANAYPEGRLVLIARRDNVLERRVPFGVESANFSRWVYSSGEFGVSFSVLIFGFPDVDSAFNAARSVSGTIPGAETFLDAPLMHDLTTTGSS